MKPIGLILLIVGILWAVALVPVNFLGSSWPTTGLVSPIFCGAGNQINTEVTVRDTGRVRSRVTGTVECIDATGAVVNDTVGSTLLIASIVPAVILGVVGIALMNAGAMMKNMGGASGMREMSNIAKVPEVKAKLDVLMNELKNGRISYQDYTVKAKKVMDDYKATQQQSATP